jgi:DNA-binding protein YbaB
MSAAVEAVMTRMVKQRELLQAMDEHGKSISARVSSYDRSVSVEVDGSGSMTGLWLGERAYRHGAPALAAMIVQTAHAAAKVASDRQRYLLADLTARLAALQRTPPATAD